MDSFMYKGEEFYVSGKLDLHLFFKKRKTNICTSQIKAGIKNILFAILYWESYIDTLHVLHKNSASLKDKTQNFQEITFKGIQDKITEKTP